MRSRILAHWQAGLRPADSSYAALVYAFIAVQGQVVVAFILMGLYTHRTQLRRQAERGTRASPSTTRRCLGHYAVAQGLVGLFIVHVAPRLAL